MKKTLAIVGMTAVLGAAAQASAATVTIACGTVGKELQLCKEGVARWSKKTGNTGKVFESAALTDDKLGLYQQQLAAKSSTIDVYTVDVVWPGALAQHFVDLKGKIPASELKAHFPGIVEGAQVNGAQLAMPWFTDAGLLYYRTDLLKKYGFKAAPRTWTELALMASKIQAGEQKTNKAFSGYVWQGKNYEGLTCNGMEWMVSFGGGSIVDPNGKITINNPQAAKALDTAATWIKTISPAGVTTYSEEEARGIFQSGNAAFMRNWPYAWAMGQSADSKVKGKIGVAPLPTSGGRNAATLGGWNLAVSKYSKNQAAAIDLVRYLSSPAEQKIRAIEGGFNPTISALYKDKAVLAKNPFMGQLYNVFTGAVARPSGATKAKYPQVSQAFSNAASDVLAGKMNGTQAVAKLAGDLARIKGSGW